jgi:Tfp pilus assembly protein PilV
MQHPVMKRTAVSGYTQKSSYMMLYHRSIHMPTKKILALSLIEVMMVIVVFAIGIIAVVRLLSHNVLIAQMTHHRSQATMQAKEQLEMLYTFRDTNIKK